MILNFVIEPWCQYSILRNTALMFSVTACEPKPVSVIKISVGPILWVKPALVLGVSERLVLKVISWLLIG